MEFKKYQINRRRKYLSLIGEQHTGKRRSLEIIIKESGSDLSVEEMAEICFMPSKEEQRLHIKELKLTCNRCQTNEHLVAVPIVLNHMNGLCDNVEYYCAKETRSLLYSKCWNHVQSYENRKGETGLKLIQDIE